MTGPLQLASDPTSPTQASTKNYVDQQLTNVLPLGGGTLTGALALPNVVTMLPRVDVRHVNFAGGADPTGVQDSTAAIQAAINYALAAAPVNTSDFPTVYLAPGIYKIKGTLVMPTSLHLAGDSKGGAILQQTHPTASLITVKPGTSACLTASCYGGIENIALTGSGKATAGSLLEIQSDSFILRDIHFYNTGGRGLQMNGAAERIVGYDLSFSYVRWPIVMAGDDNEDYFVNTHILGAGETNEFTASTALFKNYCYSVNCTNGLFNAPGTQSNSTILYPDPHGSVYIDKAVNVAFIGGSIKSSPMISGVRIWNGSLVKFQNIYHEDAYYGGVPRGNRAYILAGKAEQTYLTSTLTGAGLSAAVNDVSWMPQFYGTAADAIADVGDWYPYVILPQDYNRNSSAPSAYIPGVQQNQFEIVNMAGFAADGNMYVQGRNIGGSTAPSGTAWPVGSVIEQYGTGFEGAVELDNVHINQVQGSSSGGGYTEHCDQTNAYTCGEIVTGYAPDVQNPTANPATNQVGFYAPLGDPNDPVPFAQVALHLRNMEMFSNGGNPYVGQIAGHHFVSIQVAGSAALGAIEGSAASIPSSGSQQISIAAATGGSYITAPIYANGRVAGVSVSLPDAGESWDSGSGYFVKKANVFGPYQQFGNFMNGEQFQNLYCLFDTPVTAGGHIANRFCVGGGPGNAGVSSGGAATGAGIEYNSWNGTNWNRIFRVSGVNGVGSMTVGGDASVSGNFTSNTVNTGSIMATGSISVGAVTASTVASSGTVTASSVNTATLVASGSVSAGPVTASKLTVAGALTAGQNTLNSGASAAVSNTLPKVAGTISTNSSLPLVWSPYGPCQLQYLNCIESGPPLTFPVNVIVQSWKVNLLTPGSSCTTAPILSLKAGSTTLASLTFANGNGYAAATTLPATVPAGTGLQISVTTAATGCTTIPTGVMQSITYAAAD